LLLYVLMKLSGWRLGYCPHCQTGTGFKKMIGKRTLAAIAFTGGLWLLALRFYPHRCVICARRHV